MKIKEQDELIEQSNDLESLIEALQQVTREDSPILFAESQFTLGSIFKLQGNVEKAIQFWESIKREDSPEQFAMAQFNLGVTFDAQGDVDKAIQAWESIKREDSHEQFAMAQFNLGVTFYEQGDVDKAIKAWASIKREDFPKQFAQAQFNLGNTFKQQGNIARAIQYWGLINKDDYPRAFHKAKINLGFAFYELGDIDNAIKIWESIKREAPPEIFEQAQFNLGNMFEKKGNVEKAIQVWESIKREDSVKSVKEDLKINEVNDNFIYKLPLYRCIYIEPPKKNNQFYLRVAHRDELTFYRDSVVIPETGERWKEYKYKDKIKDIEDKVRTSLEKIRTTFAKIKSDNGRRIATEIMLPLRYLIKHSAFREEQECRIIYISDICDKKIQANEEHNQMYIEYGSSLIGIIHKIYLSPGAEKYKDYFRKILLDKEGKKVISSTNPFRIK